MVDGSVRPVSVFNPGDTCWRTAQATRAAFLVASDAYFTAVLEALPKARHSILLLGWTFDPRTRLAPDGRVGPAEPDQVGQVLLRLSAARPDLDIRLLIWKSALPIAATQQFFPHAARKWFAGTRIRFCLDDQVPFGACHHQKVLVIDDRLAFCGGGDISVDRWDSWRHLPEDLRRVLPTRALHAPRHEMMMMVDGEAASALGDVFRDRWRRAGAADADLSSHVGASLSPEDPWPSHVAPHVTNTKVAIARTLPAWRKQPVIDEIRRLTLECIAQARETIYLENQYFTSPLATEAIAARLAEPNGPEVVLITTGTSPSWFDRLTMDRARSAMLSRLRGADLFGRFRAFYPATSDGQNIIVHSKCSIFDDQVVRIGSANLNNRSFGFDTECELGVECTSRAAKKNLQAFRDELVAHYLGVGAGEVAGARAAHGGLAAAIDALNDSQRLRPIRTSPPNALDRFFSTYHLGDPADVADSWRWRRRHKQLTAEAQRVLSGR